MLKLSLIIINILQRNYFFFQFSENLLLPFGRISGESLEFFGRMNAILQKQENMMRAAQVEVTHTRFPPLHLLHASNMYSLCHERTSAVSRPTTAAAMTSVDRRSGLNGELGGPRAQLWRAAVHEYAPAPMPEAATFHWKKVITSHSNCRLSAPKTVDPDQHREKIHT